MVVFPLLTVLGLAAASAAVSPRQVNYKDASLPIEERVSDLLSRMTVEDEPAKLIQGSVKQKYTESFCVITTGEYGTDLIVIHVILRTG